MRNIIERLGKIKTIIAKTVVQSPIYYIHTLIQTVTIIVYLHELYIFIWDINHISITFCFVVHGKHHCQFVLL